MLFGSQIFILNGIPRFYEVPISSGLFFSITGINFVLLAFFNEKTNFKNIFIGCLCLALSVACRPTYIFSSLIIIPFILKRFIENLKNKKDIVKNVLVVAIPYLTVGILLMYYNYIRFGSFFEFGAKYQLTVNDMLHLSNRFATIWTGLICSLFSIPNFIPNFPFISNHNNLITFYGYYYIENMVGGLFILVPICFWIFKFPFILKKINNKELIVFITMLIFDGFLICILSVIMGGSMQRYIVDYGWMFVLAGICIIIEHINIFKSNEAKDIIKKLFAFLTIYIVIINLCSGIVSEKSFMKNNSPEQFYMVNFWE